MRHSTAQVNHYIGSLFREVCRWLSHAMILIGLATVAFLLTWKGSTKGSLEYSVQTPQPSTALSQNPTPQGGTTRSEQGVVIIPLEK